MGVFRDGAFAVVEGVFLEVFAQIGPAAADADHDPLTGFADKAHVQFDGGVFAGLVEMVEFDFWFAVLSFGSWFRCRRWC